MLEAARRHLDPAPVSEVENFVIALGTIVATTLSAEEARVKAKALAGLLDEVPVGVIRRKDTLKRAGRTFRFVPTYQELDAFLGEEARRYRASVQRLEVLVNTPLMLAAPEKPQPPRKPTHAEWRASLPPEQRAFLDEMQRRREAGEPIASLIGLPVGDRGEGGGLCPMGGGDAERAHASGEGA